MYLCNATIQLNLTHPVAEELNELPFLSEMTITIFIHSLWFISLLQ